MVGKPFALLSGVQQVRSESPALSAATELPTGWSNISDVEKMFNIVETWAWAAIVLGKIQHLAHVAWWCTLYAAESNAPPPQPGATLLARPSPALQAMGQSAAAAAAQEPPQNPRQGVTLVDPDTPVPPAASREDLFRKQKGRQF
eukprot:4837128-Amphidinium_carterae.1